LFHPRWLSFQATSLSLNAIYIYNSESLPKAQAECAYSFGPGPWAPVPGPGVLHGMLLKFLRTQLAHNGAICRRRQDSHLLPVIPTAADMGSIWGRFGGGGKYYGW
jgi:hypothetical protein